ncbi:MAG: hypothetical protein LUO98_08475 [Methanoregula sp.]|nr:hypothetical protein [Methanoregula sp.]
MEKRELARGLLDEFARETGLAPEAASPRRYLWTDAFAACTHLGLSRTTGSGECRELALRLIWQVHHTLGRYRSDDARKGWISGLAEEEGARHPTAGGLRIGKSLPERGPDEPPDERKEWDRDGQYFHYLTKWMHTLCVAGKVTGDPSYTAWAVELARTSHARFTYLPGPGAPKRMYWKMSTDLSRPLVPSMGQHDPLDGLVTFRALQEAARAGTGPKEPVLVQEIAGLAEIGRFLSLETADPLGTGGLLADALQIARLAIAGDPVGPELLEEVMDAALIGLASFDSSDTLELPAQQRLAFRELGLSIGLSGIEKLADAVRWNPDLVGSTRGLISRTEALAEFIPLRDTLEGFWLQEENRKSASWTGHRDINTVMLAASLAPEGYLGY